MRRLIATLLVALGASSCQTGAPGAESLPSIQLQEIVRIGVRDGPEEFQFTGPGALTIEPRTGEIYVGDRGSFDIRVFSRDGELLRSWGRSGEGPGEFSGPPDLAVARDTVMASGGSRFHIFGSDGRHLGTWMPKTELALASVNVVADSRGWVDRTMEYDPFNADGAILERFYRVDVANHSLNGPIFEIVHDLDALGILSQQHRAVPLDGGIISVPGPEYELCFYPEPGSKPRRLRFDVERVPVARTAMSEYETVQRAKCEGSSNPARCRRSAEARIDRMASRPVPDQRPVVGDLRGSQVGLVLVFRADLDPTPYTRVDNTAWELVNLEDGRLGIVDFPPDFRFRWLGVNEVWGFSLDDLDIPYIVGYRFSVRSAKSGTQQVHAMGAADL